MTELQEKLLMLQDVEYRDFQSGLMPTMNRKTIIGIRTPVLRAFAKEFSKKGKTVDIFMRKLPHFYYEENNLHMMLIAEIKDYDRCILLLERFLPYINNWATCDSPAPKCFTKHKEELLPHIYKWIASGETYTIRYGVGMLMRLYLDEDFKPEYLELVGKIKSDEYYVNMMIAWYFATALAKQWNSAIIWLEEKRLPEWVHKQTIKKACESLRISDEKKEYLKKLRQ